MTQDFVTTLRLQLREAAEREARRGPFRRALPQGRPLALAGAMAALLVAIVIAVGTLRSPDQVTTTEHAPTVVARLALANSGGAVASGFSSLWLTDPGTGRVLRVGLNGAVAAAIPIRGALVTVEAGAGAVWALTDERVIRIDPATNRVAARITLPLPTGSYGGMIASGGALWVGNGSEVLRVDPRTNTIDKHVSVEHAGQAARGGAGDGRELYTLRGDGVLDTLDARTGNRVAAVRPAVEGLPGVAAGGTVFLGNGSGVAAVDSRTGRLRWRTSLGVSRINGATYGNDALWVQGTPVSGTRDQLWRLDPRTGHVTAALPLPDFGATGMITTAGKLWIMSPAGVLIQIR